MTRPFSEVTGQPPYSADNGKTDEFPHDHISKTICFLLTLYNTSEKIYSDQTGRFTITSSKGSKYVMIVYEYNSNHIHGEPIKSRNAADLARAYEKVHKMFTPRGMNPQLHILDNECSNIFNNFMTKVDEKFQFVPPHLHKRNAAERSIQKFKNHFISGISRVKKYPPMHL